MKKLALVIPPTPFLGVKAQKIPLGVAYVVSTLENLNYEIMIFDLTDYTEWDKAENTLKEITEKYTVIGFTGTSAHSFFLKKASKVLRSQKPHLKLIVGGPIAMAEPQIVKYFDLVVVGHIEMIGEDDLIKRTGLFYTPSLPKNLDEIQKPKREILLNRACKTLPIITSRYCPFKCSFCYNSLRSSKEALKRHSVQRVIEEIKDCCRLGYNTISFQDDTFILSKSWILQLFDAVTQERLNISFDCRARVDTVDEEILKNLRKFGCNSISYGIESGSQAMLDIMNKRTTIDQNSLALRLAKNVGIKTKAYFLLGVPGETEKTLKESMIWLESNHKNIDKLYVYMWIPFPGSKLYLQRGNTFNIVKFKTEDSATILGESMYRSASENCAVIETPILSAEKLESYFYKIKNTYAEKTAFEA